MKDDKVFADDPEGDLELVKFQLNLWEKYITGQKEILELAQAKVDETEEKIESLREKKESLEGQIDAETMGHPSDYEPIN